MHFKVHKIEIFFGFDFEICNISLLVMSNIKILPKKFLIGPVLEEVQFFRVVWRLRGKENFLSYIKIIFNFFFFMNPLYEPILVFPKFDQLTAPGMALCVDLGPKCQNLFRLVWDFAESSLA